MSHTSRRRFYVLAGCAFVALGIGVAIGLSTSRRVVVATAPVAVRAPVVASAAPTAAPAPAAQAQLAPTPSPAVQPAPPPAPPVAAAPVPNAPPATVSPSFDIVRVTPDGSAVLAGRAAPGTAVTVEEAGKTVGQALTDSRGAWVMVPSAKLPAGAGELTLTSRAANGQTSVAEAPVVIVVPKPPEPAQPAQPAPPVIALLSPPTAPSRLLQAPPDATPEHKLGLGTVDYDEHGAIHFSGTAPPDSSVRAYVDNSPVGDATVDGAGHWTMSPPQEVQPGVHQLRLDQLTSQGQVANRVELPFKRETLALSQVADGQIVVQPGQNLWRLARRSYGTGIRYTVIFLANRDQIRDANLIYPGQIFTTPGAATPAVAATGLSH